MITAVLSLVAGFLSVLAPCILPLLPIIIGGGLTGDKDKKRPYIIIVSLVISLVLFTVLLRTTTRFIDAEQYLRYVSGGIVIILGLVMLFPDIWDKFLIQTGLQAKSQRLLGKAGQSKSQTGSAILTGVALGPVFSSCSPMYGWIIAQILVNSSNVAYVYLGFYVIGLSLALLGITLFGQRLLDKIKWATDPKGLFTKIVAVLFIAVGVAVAFGYDQDLQSYLVEQDFINIKSIENKLVPDDF